jgi:PhzF family phenazine biosynthesis protein
MRLPMLQVDAFADRIFTGNPAAVVPLDSWLPDALMQSIAAENNLAETAFFVPRGSDYELRWFTPTVEVDLCGHATLASAFVVFTRLKRDLAFVRFHTRSGPLQVTSDGTLLALDLPARPPNARPPSAALAAALGRAPLEQHAARDAMAVFADESEVRALSPDMALLAKLDDYAVIATAPGRDCDFVSRFFAPKQGVAEDPVTGSAHCTLVPYWARRLGKRDLVARQVSARGGTLRCRDQGDRVTIAGACILYLEGFIEV